MLGQLNMFGKDKVETAIERIQAFEPEEGYYLAFSGGKDSITVKRLMDMAGVKYDAHYSVTSVDPPELVQFVKTFPDVALDIPTYKEGGAVTMWNLIQKKTMPPTRIVRYCCSFLKETQGRGRFVVTGVRWAESTRRNATRAGLELSDNNTSKRELLDPDNDRERLAGICQAKAQRFLNPIIDWETADVWEFIKAEGLRYCSLYDEGFTRLGCVGCPMAPKEKTDNEFTRWPKYKTAYLKAFDRMLSERKKRGMPTEWETPEAVMGWWLNSK